MIEGPALLAELRLAAVILMFGGIGLIANASAHGPSALTGFGMFCLGIAALDGLYRGRFGFRQPAVLLGWLAVGMGAWALLARGLLGLLELPVGGVIDGMLIAAAACACGCAGASLLAVRSPDWMRAERLAGWFEAIRRRVPAAALRPGRPRHDLSLAEPRWRRAGPVRGG